MARKLLVTPNARLRVAGCCFINLGNIPRAESSAKHAQVIIVLPVYNKEENIGTLLGRIDEATNGAGLAYRVIVVDDASRDRTLEVIDGYARHIPIDINRHRVNQRTGYTIRDGLLLAMEATTSCSRWTLTPRMSRVRSRVWCG